MPRNSWATTAASSLSISTRLTICFRFSVVRTALTELSTRLTLGVVEAVATGGTMASDGHGEQRTSSSPESRAVVDVR